MARLSSTAEMQASKSSAKGTETKGMEKGKPEHDRIAKRTYQIWERKGRPVGQSEQNWREAEAELR